jgi:integrase
VRVLLAVTTGLRRGDIETIRVGDIHFDRNTITTRNRKAGKAMPERSIPEPIMMELSKHVATPSDGQEKIFTDRFSPKKWERIRKAINTPDLKFHDLRKTFPSPLAPQGVSTAVTQRLWEHSSPHLANDVYTNVDPVLRQASNQWPVSDWLQRTSLRANLEAQSWESAGSCVHPCRHNDLRSSDSCSCRLTLSVAAQKAYLGS